MQVSLNQPLKFPDYHAFQFELGIFHYFFLVNIIIVYKYYDFL